MRARGHTIKKSPEPSAEIVFRTCVVPTIAATFETCPELDVPEVLECCVAALAGKLREEFRAERQQLLQENRKRLR